VLAQAAAALWRRVAALAPEGGSAQEKRYATRARDRYAARGGTSNKDIATRLGIEVATVKNHVHNVLRELRYIAAQAVLRLQGRTPEPGPTPFP